MASGVGRAINEHLALEHEPLESVCKAGCDGRPVTGCERTPLRGDSRHPGAHGAAHAMAEDSVVITNNAREFHRVPGLGLKNGTWIDASTAERTELAPTAKRQVTPKTSQHLARGGGDPFVLT